VAAHASASGSREARCESEDEEEEEQDELEEDQLIDDAMTAFSSRDPLSVTCLQWKPKPSRRNEARKSGKPEPKVGMLIWVSIPQ